LNKTNILQNRNAVIKSMFVSLFFVLLFYNPTLAQDYCLNFDGVNDYVSASTIPSFNSNTTIEAWIKIVKPTGYSIAEPNIVSWGADANSVEFRLGFSGSTATLQFGIDATGSGGGAWQAIYGSTNLNTGNWVHVAVVKNGSTSTLYINGASETSGTISRSPTLNTFDIGNLNEHGSQQNRYFPGLIDEVRLWNVARSQSDIQSTMTTVLSGSETGLTNYYKMTNGSGTTLTDNKGSSNGTINGATWQTPGVPLLPVSVYVGGTYATCYATLKAAFDAINAGTHTGAITLKITGSTTETSTAALNYSGSGSASYTSVNIYPTSTGLSISGNLTSPLIDLNGADNVTIDGRVNASGSTKDMVINNTSNSSNGGTSAIRLYNGANNNCIKYCTIKGSTTDGSGGVIFLGGSSASTGNTIDNNNITSSADAYRPINAIYSGGAANTVTISNNYIYDYLSRISSSNGVNLNTSTGASTISGNSFYETSTFNPTANRAYYFPIYINSTVAGFTVSGNYIGGNAPLCSGTFIKSNTAFSNLCAINLTSVGTGTASIVKGNTINGINWSNNNNDNTWMYGININAGDVTLGANGEPNTIGSITGTPNLSFTYDGNGSIFVPIYMNGSGYINCQYNNIGGITCSNTNSSYVTRLYCIYRENNNVNAIISNNTIGSSTNPITLTSPATGDVQYMVGICNNSSATSGLTMNNNIISYLSNQTTGTSAGYVCGILSYDMAAPLTISGNNIHDLTIANSNGGSGRDASMRGGIWVTTGYQLIVTNNTVYNLSNTNSTFNGYMYGIFATGGGTSITNDCSGNTVYNISATGSSAGPFIYGIYFNAYSSSTNTVNRNYVYGLSCAGVGGNYNNTRYYGIYKPSSAHNITYANNIISLGNNYISNIYGIYEEGVSGNASNIYFNTIYISGTPTVGGLSSYAIFSASNDSRTFKNNVLYNARSNNGANGNHYCIYYGSNPATSDYNDLYAPGTGGCMGYYNGNACGTLANWRTITSTEANSLNINPIFVSGFKTAATLNGITGTGITTDYEGITRGNPPRMGAYESAGVITYTWTGATSTAFNVNTNWELNITPPDGTDFSFAASPVNHCLLDQSRTLGNVTNASGKDLVANGYQLTIPGTMTFTSTGKIDATASGSTVVYSGSSAQSFTSCLFKNNTVYNLTLNNSNGLTQNGDLTVSNALTLTSGALSIGANTLTLNGSITYTSGTLTGGSSSNISFGGSGASTNLAAITLNNLILNRANGISLTGNVTINHSLTLSNGILNTGSYYLNFSTSALSPTETSGSRIVGNAKILEVSVGKGAFDFLGFKMYSGADDLDNISLVRKTGTAGVVTIGSNTSIACNWDVTVENQPVSGRNIEYRWLSDLDNGKSFGANNKSVNYFSTNNGTNWVELGTHIDVSTSNPRVMSLTTTHFSKWVSTGENSPLPVTLSTFSSSVKTRDVKLNWVTASEVNNAGFEVERVKSSELRVQSWEKIGFVSGKGTTNSQTSYTYSDTKLNSGKYQYRLKQIDNNGNFEYFNLNGEIEIGLPSKYELSQNYPNPFNPVTKIDFSLPYDSKVQIVVYDITGREVKVLLNETRTAGFHTLNFDASGLSSGMYIYRINAKSSANDFSNTKKLMLIK
jgi:Concanavalin A-like lectin/glucanases superfamily/Secretion system C-terminal sorting domain